MTRKKPPIPKRVGSRQHHWMYGGPDPWKAEPFRFDLDGRGMPPTVLRNLVKKRWMWAEKYFVCRYQPNSRNWTPTVIAYGRCGLTQEGLEVIATIRDRLKAEYEQSRLEPDRRP